MPREGLEFPDIATLSTAMSFLTYQAHKYLIDKHGFSLKQADLTVNIALAALYVATCEFSFLRVLPFMLSVAPQISDIPQSFKTAFTIAYSFFPASSNTVTAGILGGIAGTVVSYENFP